MNGPQRILEIIAKSNKGLTTAQVITALAEIPWSITKPVVMSNLCALVKKGALQSRPKERCKACGYTGHSIYSVTELGKKLLEANKNGK